MYLTSFVIKVCFVIKVYLLLVFLIYLKTSIVACYFRFFEILKRIREYLLRIIYSCKNYREKLIYNKYF